MSADNYTVCPECILEKKNAFEEKRKRIAKESESLPDKEKQEVVRALFLESMARPDTDLREWIEYGLEGFGLTLRYRCKCHACGFEYAIEKRVGNIKEEDDCHICGEVS